MDATADDFGYGEGATGSSFSDIQNKASEWGNNMRERIQNTRQEAAKNIARFAEKGASNTGSEVGKYGAEKMPFAAAVDRARTAEGSGGFANNVKGKTLEDAAAASMPGGKMLMKQTKKFGPFGTILAIVTILVATFAGSQTFSAFSFVENGLDQFNNLRTSMNRRSTYFTRFAMDRTRNKPITKNAYIFGPERFKISNKLSNKLAKQGVYYVDSDDFNCRFLLYEDVETGKTYAIAANDAEVSKLPSGGVDVEVNGQMRHFDISDSGRMKLDDALIDSKHLSRSVDVGTRTLKGHVAGWFDDVSAKFHERIISSRNKRKNVDKDASEEEVKKKTQGADEGLDNTIKKTRANEDGKNPQETDEQLVDDGKGNKVNQEVPHDYVPDPEDGPDVDLNAKSSDNDIRVALKNKVGGVIDGMGKVSDIYCTVMKSYSMLSAIVAGVMVANILNYVTGFLEAIQKTQAGDAGTAELSYYMNGLSQRGATLNSDGEVIKGKENTSSLESPAWNQFFSSGSLVVSSTNDEAAKKFNRDYFFSMAIGGQQAEGVVSDALSELHKKGITDVVAVAANSLEAYKACLTSQIATAGASMAITIIVAACSFGVGALIKDWASNFLKSAARMAIQTAIMMAFTAFIPYIAKWLALDLIENMAGEDAAYAINSGMNMYLGRQMQASSGLPATEDKLMAHWREQQEVIAEEGAFERSMRSPFDVTSKYTFLGSLFNSLMPIANTWRMPLTTISKTMNTVGNAASQLLPTARADGEVRFETSLKKDCPTLSSIDLVGDAYCNPYFVTDFSTMAADPIDVFNYVANDTTEESTDIESGETNNIGTDNFVWETMNDAEHDGNPDIKAGSKLSKWVLSCAVRDSQFGQIDSNVMNAIAGAGLVDTGNEKFNNAISMGLSMVPLVSDAEQIAQAARETANFGWASGENCVSEDYKWYSRYSEDQRMMESAGIIKKSAVAKFLEEYYEKNPIDNSREGIIARYSGYTKEEVVAMLDNLEVIAWLNEYNPETYGPLKYEEKPDGSYQYESNENVSESEKAVVGNYIIFDDLRTKIKVA